MNKFRSCMKSVKSRGSLACAFLVRAWGKLLCRMNWHNDGQGVWHDLQTVGASGVPNKVGDRVVFTCARCGSSVHCDGFDTEASRMRWNAAPEKRRIILRDWGK